MARQASNLYVKLTDEDRNVIEQLERTYPGMTRSDIVRRALQHMLETRPIITIEPHNHTQAVARLG